MHSRPTSSVMHFPPLKHNTQTQVTFYFTWVYKNVINTDTGEGQEDYNK